MSGFVLQLETTGAPHPKRRVEKVLVAIADEMRAGKSSGAIHHKGKYIGRWGFTR